MSFRKIRPSFGESSASASTSNPSTSESTGSDPRRNRGEGASKEGGGSQTSFKRRRVPESVTRNACLNCKKARAKCDGKQPCKRCASRVETSECVYEVHIKHAKEELVRQIKDLKTKDQMTEQILHALSTDEKVPEILERLRKGGSYQSIVEWLGRTPMEDGETLSPRGSQHSTFDGPTSDQEMGGTGEMAFRWTYVTSNTAVLDHLFQLYFAWVHPVHTLFSEGHFVDSYQRQSEQYCSETLVNAICAMACHLHSPVEREDIDFQQLGLEFSEAVRSNIEPQDSTITTIQAFAVLFLVDCSQGKGLRASSYLNVASSNLARFKPLQTDGFSVVLNNTIRGIRNLNVEWSQMTFRVPRSVDLAHSLYNEDADASLDNAKWHFYRYVNDQCPAWPGLLATTNREKAKLVKIIEESLHIMYAAHGQQRVALDILLLYRRLVAWREDLPVEIGDVENNASQALPHVLSLLILYENTVVQLLRPLLDFEGFPSSLVEDVVWNHGQYALFLLDEHYHTQYTCRYQPVLQMFSVLHISDVMARFFPMATEGPEGTRKNGAQAVQFGLECVMQSRAGFPVAGPLQQMLRRTAIECSIPLPPNLPELMAPLHSSKKVYHMDDLIDACTRPSYRQPVDDIHKKYAESFAADWTSASAAFGFREPEPGARRLRVTSAEERGAQSLMQIRNLLNS